MFVVIFPNIYGIKNSFFRNNQNMPYVSVIRRRGLLCVFTLVWLRVYFFLLHPSAYSQSSCLSLLYTYLILLVLLLMAVKNGITKTGSRKHEGTKTRKNEKMRKWEKKRRKRKRETGKLGLGFNVGHDPKNAYSYFA